MGCVSAIDRLLLLDVQSLFNYDATSDAELKSEFHFVLFLASICHTLLVVVDTPVDMQLLKFLRLIACIKAKVPDFATWIDRPGDNPEQLDQLPLREVLPKLVVAYNNIGYHLDDSELFAPTQAILTHSLWKDAPSVQHMRIPTLPGDTVASMLRSDEAYATGTHLRSSIFRSGPARGRFGKDALQLTEGDWLLHICGYWEFVQMAPSVQEYFSVVANGLESYGWPKV